MRAIFLLLLFVSPAVAQGPAAIRFPEVVAPVVPAPAPQAVSRLSANELFVIDADIPLLVFASPQGLVSITEEAGPLRIRAHFVGGSKIQSKTFKGKYIYVIDAAKSGDVEIIVVPVSATKASDAIRKQLAVDAGEGPRPPPKPIDPPDAFTQAVMNAYATESSADRTKLTKYIALYTEMGNVMMDTKMRPNFKTAKDVFTTLGGARTKLLADKARPTGYLLLVGDVIGTEFNRALPIIETTPMTDTLFQQFAAEFRRAARALEACQ